MNKIASAIEKFFIKCIPDAFPLSFLLLLICILLSWLMTDSSIAKILGVTAYGMPTLLEFTMQIVLVMVLGYVVSTSPPVERILGKIARSLGENPIKVIFLTSLICNAIEYVNTSIGMIAGAIIAREVIKNNKRVRPGVVVAAAYAGMCVHCIGISPAIFSTVATPGHGFEEQIGIVPFSDTTFFLPNILIAVVLGVGIPIVLALVQPRNYVNPMYDPDTEEDRLAEETEKQQTAEVPSVESEVLGYQTSAFVRFFENGSIFSYLLGAILLIGLFFWVRMFEGSLNFYTLIVCFFGLGLILWGDLGKVAKSAEGGVRTMYAVVISFPIYAAIMCIMTDTGLADVISNFIISKASADSLPVLSFLSAGLINIFVPSAGGQWVVQAPTMIPAAQALGTSMNKIVTAVALGDCWTNMIQPFWALPFLGITKIKVREMIAFTTIVCIFEGIVVCLIMGFVYPHF